MTQEDKELLLKDICARLPYDVKVSCNDKVYNFNGIQYFNICTLTDDNENNAFTTAGIKYIKPYLFPMSSMTEEQEEELKNIYYSFNGMFHYTERIFDRIPFSKMKYFPYQIEEFFNKNHIDYRGLIPKGLANDATGLNIY